jgi:hypothetical protein
MKRAELPLPLIGAISGTRGLAGLGAGLLLAERLDERKRRALGWSLLAAGALSTIPLMLMVARRLR